MEIVTMDALEYMDSFEPEVFDLVLLDPDYQDWERLIQQGLLARALRVLKHTGNILCFTKQPFDFELRVAVQPWFRRELVWSFDNGGAWCSAKMPLISTQKIYWLAKSKDFFFNPRTGLPYGSKTRDFKRKSKVFGDYVAEGRDFKQSPDGVWLRDHLHYNKPNCGKIPAKPQELVDLLVRCFTPSGGVILDPFVGTGTTIHAAERHGCDVYASEIDEERTMALLDKLFYEVTQPEQ